MNRELTHAGILVTAQSCIGIVAWFYLGGPSLSQLIEAGLVAIVPTSIIFFVREMRLQASGAQTKPLTGKLIVRVDLLWLAVVSILSLYSLVLPIDSYTFNVLIYVTALGFSAGLVAWLAWTRFRACQLQDENDR